MLAFAPTIGWVFVARIIEGLSGGNISVTQAYVADRVAPEQRARAFAWIGAAFSGGMIFGPATGGYLLGRYGYRTPFLLAAGLQVLTLLLTDVLAARIDREEGRERGAASASPTSAVARKSEERADSDAEAGLFARFICVVRRVRARAAGKSRLSDRPRRAISSPVSGR